MDVPSTWRPSEMHLVAVSNVLIHYHFHLILRIDPNLGLFKKR